MECLSIVYHKMIPTVALKYEDQKIELGFGPCQVAVLVLVNS